MRFFRLQILASSIAYFVSGSLFAYPLPISRFQADGSLYVESSSIVRANNSVRLTYVENFEQAQAYGSGTYMSKATQIRIDCAARLVYEISESFYTGADLGGVFLGRYPKNDVDGQYAEHGSWVSEVVKVGCSFN